MPPRHRWPYLCIPPAMVAHTFPDLEKMARLQPLSGEAASMKSKSREWESRTLMRQGTLAAGLTSGHPSPVVVRSEW
jgi:hypothetical protein